MDHMKTTDSINRHENSPEGRKEMHANGALRSPSSWEIRRTSRGNQVVLPAGRRKVGKGQILWREYREGS